MPWIQLRRLSDGWLDSLRLKAWKRGVRAVAGRFRSVIATLYNTKLSEVDLLGL
jgi:hypothetical protein